MSLKASQIKGTHIVTNKSERVWVLNNWSIEIPAGYTYIVDPEKAGGEIGEYLLHVQKSSDCNFSVSYSSDFNVVVYGKMGGLSCNCDDMSDEQLLQSLEDLFGQFQIHRCSRDLVVLYEAANETEEYTSYAFQVVTRGCNIVFSGQFLCSTGTISERRKDILHWLDTIEVLTETERLAFVEYSENSNMTIPIEYSREAATIDHGIKISIPHGFHYETDSSVIGDARRLVIVPDYYSLSDDPMEAPVGLSIQSAIISGLPTRIDLLDKYFAYFCDRGFAFLKEKYVTMYKRSDLAFSVSQCFLDDYFSKSITALFYDDKVYIIHLIINYPEYEFDKDTAWWDIEHLSKAWLARIQVDGETVPDYPSRYTSQSEKTRFPTIVKPASNLYPHYNQLGDTSKPRVGSIGETIITNAGGTEFECYPFARFEGKLKDVADNITSKDICEDEYKQLVSTAIKYSALFCVNKESFNLKEDRECDIRNLRMRRAYQLHALRSFAWTLAEVSTNRNKQLSDLENGEYEVIFDFIEKRKFLNYKSESHYPTLCGTADLHVFFIPDSTNEEDKSILENSSEDFGSSIPNSLASLDGLRRDLYSLSASMEQIYQRLLSTRNFSRPLTGTEADVLYAWCTLVLSAETPFYIEDGPMTCFYTQITDPATTFSSGKIIQSSSATTQKMPEIPDISKNPVVTSSKDSEAIKNKVYENILAHAKAVINPLERAFPRGIVPGEDDLDEIGGTLYEYTGFDKHIILPSRIDTLSSSVFNGVSTESVVIPDTVKEIGSWVFQDCMSLTGVKLPSRLKSIGSHVFEGCWSLKYVKLPVNLTILPEDMFNGCSALEAIIIPDVCTKIENRAFEGCDMLKYVVLPNSLLTIGDWAFQGCSELESILIPDGCKTIGDFVFSDCTCLTDVYIPASVHTIGSFAFEPSVMIHTQRNSAAEKWAFENGVKLCYDIDLYNPHATLEISVDPVLDGALSNDIYTVRNGKLVSIKIDNNMYEFIIPKGVHSIGAYAYENVVNDEGIVIFLPEGLESIESNAFRGCRTISKIVIPPTVTYIDKNAFVGGLEGTTIDCVAGSFAEQYALEHSCSIVHDKSSIWSDRVCKTAYEFQQEALQEVRQKAIIEKANKEIIKVAKKVSISAAKAYTIEERELTDYSGSTKTINIPDGVTSIGRWCFDNRSDFTQPRFKAGVQKAEKIILPASIIRIDLRSGFPSNALLIGPDTPFLRAYFESHNNQYEFESRPEDEKYLTAIEKAVDRERKRIEKQKQEADAAREAAQAEAKAVEDRLKAEAEAKEAAEKARAEEEARQRAEEEARQRAEEEARQRAEEEARQRAEEEARQRAEEEARQRAEEEARQKAEEEARQRAEEARIKAEEARKMTIHEERLAKYEELLKNIRQQKTIIEQNRGWFGNSAKVRKAAQEKLRSLEKLIQDEFPEGKP